MDCHNVDCVGGITGTCYENGHMHNCFGRRSIAFLNVLLLFCCCCLALHPSLEQQFKTNERNNQFHAKYEQTNHFSKYCLLTYTY
jgi:hypothetical protein